MNKKALITGITGQDGSYLAEYLLSLGYEVHGIVRRVASEYNSWRFSRIKHLFPKIFIHSGSIENYQSLHDIIYDVKPDECYHLAAQSFVANSFDDQHSTLSINTFGTHYIISIIKKIKPECKFYFAASSEMFGKVEETPQNEKTKFHPRSIYGISKLAAYEITRNYREAYNMFACSGIMFNHESPRRGSEFVTRKISIGVAKIKLGLEKKISLGNINARRDWGYALDYVEAMHKMLQNDTPDDFVIGTGKTYSVKDFMKLAFECLDLDYEKYLNLPMREIALSTKAEFMICKSWFNLSNDVLRDQTETMIAIDKLQYYIEKESLINYSKEISDMIFQLRNKLAEKKIKIAELYLQLEQQKGAEIYFESIVNQFYDTKYLEDALLNVAYIKAGTDKEAAINYLETNRSFFESEDKFKAAISKIENKQ